MAVPRLLGQGPILVFLITITMPDVPRLVANQSGLNNVKQNSAGSAKRINTLGFLEVLENS